MTGRLVRHEAKLTRDANNLFLRIQNIVDEQSANSDPEQSLAIKYRYKRHFATFTDAQYESLNLLLNVLANEFDIPYQLVQEADRFDTFLTSQVAQDFKGISSHVNYRRTGKTDIGPAFDWARIGG